MPFAPLIQCNTCQRRRLGSRLFHFFITSLALSLSLSHTHIHTRGWQLWQGVWNLKNEVVLEFLCVYKHSNSFICHILWKVMEGVCWEWGWEGENKGQGYSLAYGHRPLLLPYSIHGLYRLWQQLLPELC